jgi:CMP/dCMP kinase
MTPADHRIVAIDGPAGAGKSTVARRLAGRLGYVLLDTGALYRALALAARRDGISWDDEAAVVALAEALAAEGSLTLGAESGSPDEGVRAGTGPRMARGVWLRGEDVAVEIREPAISIAASRVSSYPGVREAFLGLQRRLATRGTGVVAEGRDMGTVVFPDALVKFFLTASVEVRAQRRFEELRARGLEVDIEATRADVIARDAQDAGRAVAPLRQAEDAVAVDSSDRDVDAIVDEMLAIVHARLG